MAVTINGKVFNDINHNGLWSSNEPGIENCCIVLEDPNGVFNKVFTDSNGNYSFTGLGVTGTYKIYNLYKDPGNPITAPFTCAFPTGFNGTTAWRRWDITVTAADISSNKIFVDANNNATTYNNRTYFGYDNAKIFDKPYGIIVALNGNINYVDVATGKIMDTGVPGRSVNGMGFGTKDFFVYGGYPQCLERLSADGIRVDYPLPIGGTSHFGGDTDNDGHLYNNPGNGYYCTDVNPYRVTFGRSLNSQNNFSEITSGSAALPYKGIASNIAAAECLYRYTENRIYRPAGNICYWLDPFTGEGGSIPINNGPVSIAGVGFLDNVGNGYIGGQSKALSFDPTSLPTEANAFTFPQINYSVGDGARNGNLPIYFAIPEIVKFVDKAVAKLGDELIYTLVIKNVGNIEANILSLIDTIPIGTTFVDNSITLDGIPKPGTTILPPNGFSDPTKVQVDDLATVTFKVTIVSLPPNSITLPNAGYSQFQFIDLQTSLPYTQGQESNTVYTRVLDPKVEITKYVDKKWAFIGDNITYTFYLKNVGNIPAINMVFIDTIPDGTIYVSNSMSINNVIVPGGNPSPPLGVNVGNLLAGSDMTLSFSVNLNTLPFNSYSIPNSAILNYYGVDPVSGNTIPFSKLTNEVNTNIVIIDIRNKKYVDKNYATLNDVVTYTIEIGNYGNTLVKNNIFTDTIPPGSIFVSNSLTINGNVSGGNPEIGVNIGDLAVGQVTTITFKVMVS